MPSSRPKVISKLLEENARVIEATRARKRELVMTLQGRIGLRLRLAFPKVVDRMILRAIKKG